MEEKCLPLDRLFRDLKHYVCLYPLSYIVTPTAKRDHKNCTCDVIDFIAYLETEKIHVNPLPEAVLVLIRLYVPVKTF